jgi:hypothetical protein
VNPGYSGLFSLEKSAESLDWRLRSGISTLPKTGATDFANLVPPGLPGSDSPLLLLLVYLFDLNSNLVYGLRISSLINIECLHFTNTSNQVAPTNMTKARIDISR